MKENQEMNPAESRKEIRMQQEREKRRSVSKAIPFFIALGLLTVLAWLLPLRPEVSIKEKRELEKFPEFSVSALGSGEYFRQIDAWFSDTFTGRDTWIELSHSVERLHGRNDVVIYGNASAGDAIPIVASPSPDTVSESETTPEPTPTPTPEPTPTPWGGKDVDNELITLGAVIQVGDSAYTYTSFSQQYTEEYAANINRAAELLADKCRVFNLFVLHSTTIMLPRDYRDSIECAPEEDILTYLNSLLSEDVYALDSFNPLLRHNSEYIFYRTDHHWTSLGAWYMYEEWAKQAGFEPVGLEEYNEVVLEPFFGTLFYKANQSNSLSSDSVYAYEPPGDVHLYIDMNNRDSKEDLGFEQPLVTRIKNSDKYTCFLAGDHPLCTFINNSITDGSACLLVKNSNGNPFSYYLTQHYQYVYVMDYRYYRNRTLTEFVDYYGVDDVLFCLSSGQAQSEGGNDLLEQLIK